MPPTRALRLRGWPAATGDVVKQPAYGKALAVENRALQLTPAVDAHLRVFNSGIAEAKS